MSHLEGWNRVASVNREGQGSGGGDAGRGRHCWLPGSGSAVYVLLAVRNRIRDGPPAATDQGGRRAFFFVFFKLVSTIVGFLNFTFSCVFFSVLPVYSIALEKQK
jgi:hypothetical protein